jgi:hypothetical protein
LLGFIQPVDGLASVQLVGDAVRTTGVLAATVTIPLASMLNVLSWCYIGIGGSYCDTLTYHLSMRSRSITVLFDATVTDGSFTASLDCLLQLLPASHLMGLHSTC